MSARIRLTLLVGLTVALAIMASAGVIFASVTNELHRQDDQFLNDRADRVAEAFRGGGPGAQQGIGLPRVRPGRERGGFAQDDAVIQIVSVDGSVASFDPTSVALPVTSTDTDIAANANGHRVFRDISVNGTDYRMLTISAPNQLAIQVARDTRETTEALRNLGGHLLVIALIGVVASGLIAWIIASRAVRPIVTLAGAAETIARTNDLDHPIPIHRSDEVGRLAESFNQMLQALSASRTQQKQLAADASHELRTPLTVIRANIEFLERAQTLDTHQRNELLSETRLELDELTNLVAELVDLASDASSQESTSSVSLADIATNVAERFTRRSGRTINVEVRERADVQARPTMVERAISNFVDNAVKFSGPESPVDIVVDATSVTVMDRGIGINVTDTHRVFDRFYRAPGARNHPGSGLGLAIVQKVAADHHGEATVSARPGGGTIAILRLMTEQNSTT